MKRRLKWDGENESGTLINKNCSTCVATESIEKFRCSWQSQHSTLWDLSFKKWQSDKRVGRQSPELCKGYALFQNAGMFRLLSSSLAY